MKNNYNINFATNTITITQSFAKAANHIGSDEFNTMIQLRQLGMTISIKQPNHRKAPKNRPTYRMMQHYISLVADSDAYMKDFEAIREASKSQGNPYQYVLNWFIKTFPNHAETPEFDENRKIVVTPANYDLEEQAS